MACQVKTSFGNSFHHQAQFLADFTGYQIRQKQVTIPLGITVLKDFELEVCSFLNVKDLDFRYRVELCLE
uniref:Uncharacterized protein n=1 Tax=viral metagenome TaxID=1070528 RepID=A0A6C0BM71_9ZZZZ